MKGMKEKREKRKREKENEGIENGRCKEKGDLGNQALILL